MSRHVRSDTKMKKTQLLLGDNPFNAVSHLSQERWRSRSGSSYDDMTRIISLSIENGATGFTFSTTPLMLAMLNRIREKGFSHKLVLYPVIPDVQSYFQLMSEKGTAGALVERLRRMTPTAKVRSILSGGIGLLSSDPSRILKTLVVSEANLVESAMPHNAVIGSVFLHEIGTDLIVSLGMSKLLKTYCEVVTSSLGVPPGFVTRNFPRFIDFISQGDFGLREYYVLTPFNSVGFQMNPTRDACEEALVEAKGANVVAMSILAGGQLRLEDAVAYLKSLAFDFSCVVGVSNELHAKQTFSYLRSELLDTAT